MVLDEMRQVKGSSRYSLKLFANTWEYIGQSIYRDRFIVRIDAEGTFFSNCMQQSLGEFFPRVIPSS